MWKPRRLTTLWASTACYRDFFPLLFYRGQLNLYFLFMFFEFRLLIPARKYVHFFQLLCAVSSSGRRSEDCGVCNSLLSNRGRGERLAPRSQLVVPNAHICRRRRAHRAPPPPPPHCTTHVLAYLINEGSYSEQHYSSSLRNTTRYCTTARESDRCGSDRLRTLPAQLEVEAFVTAALQEVRGRIHGAYRPLNLEKD
jgi:hypothetical protein